MPPPGAVVHEAAEAVSSIARRVSTPILRSAPSFDEVDRASIMEGANLSTEAMLDALRGVVLEDTSLEDPSSEDHTEEPEPSSSSESTSEEEPSFSPEYLRSLIAEKLGRTSDRDYSERERASINWIVLCSYTCGLIGIVLNSVEYLKVREEYKERNKALKHHQHQGHHVGFFASVASFCSLVASAPRMVGVMIPALGSYLQYRNENAAIREAMVNCDPTGISPLILQKVSFVELDNTINRMITDLGVEERELLTTMKMFYEKAQEIKIKLRNATKDEASLHAMGELISLVTEVQNHLHLLEEHFKVDMQKTESYFMAPDKQHKLLDKLHARLEKCIQEAQACHDKVATKAEGIPHEVVVDKSLDTMYAREMKFKKP